ncbi:hypothetical protein [Ekhidna sp.]|uniref:hypothetical protein n=1 Tax=Ekhidna sp. TaxID=2608089 RepID=UPI00329787F0
MRRGLLPFLICIYGCAVQNADLNESLDDSYVQLNFQNCEPANEYKFLELILPPGYRMTKAEEHGFCEYRFEYKDESILYISSNTFSGSKLNYENRLKYNIKTYSKNRSKSDTIRNDGVEEDKKYWLEWINGSYTVGYINAVDTTKFIQALESVRLIQNPQ